MQSNDKEMKSEKNYKCDICKDEGFVFSKNEQGYELYKQCECVAKTIHKDKININNIQEKYLKDFDETEYKDIEKGGYVKRAIKKYLEKYQDIQKGLYLFSETRGSGKTLASYIIATDLINRGINIYFTTTSNLFSSLTKSISEKTTESHKILDKCKNTDVLFLDDFGAEKVSDYVNSILFNILDYRMEMNKKTIFTSNLEIKNTYVDERIKSRVEKMTFAIKFPEESIRSIISVAENAEFEKFLFA